MFDNISILIILANSAVMVFDDTGISDNPNPIFAKLELVFFVLYTAEMCFKITGLGFVFGPGTYLRDGWNILDFFIVMSSILTMGADDEHNNEDGHLHPGTEEESF